MMGFFQFMMIINIEFEILVFSIFCERKYLKRCIYILQVFSLLILNVFTLNHIVRNILSAEKNHIFLLSSSFELCLYAGFIYLTGYHLYPPRNFGFYCLVSTKSSEKKKKVFLKTTRFLQVLQKLMTEQNQHILSA